jgi:hypothetical protein
MEADRGNGSQFRRSAIANVGREIPRADDSVVADIIYRERIDQRHRAIEV